MQQHATFKTQQSSHGIHACSQNSTIICLLIYFPGLFVRKNGWDANFKEN